jgi:hypothetical protein
VKKQNGDFKNELDVRMDFPVCGSATLCISRLLFFFSVRDKTQKIIGVGVSVLAPCPPRDNL